MTSGEPHKLMMSELPHSDLKRKYYFVNWWMCTDEMDPSYEGYTSYEVYY